MCTQCTGPSNLECSACSGSNLFIAGTTYCLATCPSTMYNNGSTCIGCATECDNCTGGTSTECVRCKPPYFHHPTTAGTCIANCPTQYYKDTNTDECMQCDTNCNECQGPTINDCTGCQSGYAIVTGTNTCITYPCPDGYFDDSGDCTGK